MRPNAQHTPEQPTNATSTALASVSFGFLPSGNDPQFNVRDEKETRRYAFQQACFRITNPRLREKDE